MFWYDVELNVSVVSFDSELLHSLWIFWDVLVWLKSKSALQGFLFCHTKCQSCFFFAVDCFKAEACGQAQEKGVTGHPRYVFFSQTEYRWYHLQSTVKAFRKDEKVSGR